MSFSADEWKNVVDELFSSEMKTLITNIAKSKGWEMDSILGSLYASSKPEAEEKTVIDHKTNIISCFKVLIHKVNANDESASAFKTREYSDSIKAISEYDGEIRTMEDIKSILSNYGKKNPEKTLVKIKEILETGTLEAAEKARKDEKVLAVNNLTKVYGIGNKKAVSLYKEYGIFTVESLKKKILELPDILHDKQMIGIKYYDDLNERIPRIEMMAYEKILLDIVEESGLELKLSINGSYRRKMETSGDIDVLISSTHKGIRNKLIEILKTKKIVVETLASGNKKFMGVSIIPGYTKYRHIDIIETKIEEYPFGVLYFTGSGGFNAKMRGMALDKGYSLNEYCLSNKKTKEPITEEEITSKIGKKYFEEEKDIFDFLGIEYVLPECRVNITASKVQ